MKTILKYICILALGCSLWSCSKETELREPPISTPQPEGVSITADYYGKVRFSFPEMDTDLVKYGIIFYTEGEEKKELKVTDFSQDAVLSGLNYNAAYSFRIIYYGQTDRPSKVLATSEVVTKGSAALITLNAMSVAPIVGGLKFSFANETGRELKITFKYSNNGQTKEEVTTSTTVTGVVDLTNMVQDPTEVLVTVIDPAEQVQESKTFSATPRGLTVGQIIQSLTATYLNKEVTLRWSNTTGREANIVFSSENIANNLTVTSSASESVKFGPVTSGETVTVLAVVTDPVSGEKSEKSLTFRNSILSRTGWSILDFDSQQSLATDVLDGLPSYWHTQWGTVRLPRYISLNMAAQRTFDGLWIKSSSATPGPAKVEIFVKKNSSEPWESLGYYPVPRATIKNNDQYIILPLTTAQYIRVQMNEQNVINETHCSFSELGVFKIE
ncbi:hypothetical protein [Arcticibacter sp.]|uniref:hypothetical protein n=1 Tax=Arcticibacter sp. TaxID=1872630 RepID=UPI00389092C3